MRTCWLVPNPGPTLHVDISVLGAPVELDDPSDFVPGLDGVIVERDRRLALLLPEAPRQFRWIRSRDSNWESEQAQKLESMPEVVSHAKHQGLNLKIPYAFTGRAANYVPDFLIRIRDVDSTGADDLLTLLLEVSDEENAADLIRSTFLVPASTIRVRAG